MTQSSYIGKIKKQIVALKEQSRKVESEAKMHQKQMREIVKKAEASLDMNVRKKAAMQIEQKTKAMQIALQKKAVADGAVKELEKQLRTIESGGLVFE